MSKADPKSAKRPGAIARFSFVAVMACMLVVPSSGWAQLAATESLGVRRCADLVDAQKNNPDLYAGFGAWIGGYLTAANAYEADTFDLTPWQPLELITAQVTAACAKQPGEPIVRAVASYVRYLEKARLTKNSPLVRAQVNESAVFIYEAVLNDVRRRLLAMGAKITDPMGEFGESFSASLREYQQSNDLPRTGLPDTPTLMLLLK